MSLLLREALLSFRRAPLLSLLSITAIAFSLFTVGLFGLVALNLRQALDRALGEGLGDERAQSGVVGGVEEEQAGLAVARGHEEAHVGAFVRLARVTGHRAVTQHTLNVVLTGEHPAFDQRVVVHGLDLGIGIGNPLFMPHA